MTMKKIYTYGGQEYESLNALRTAMGNVLFPDSASNELLAELGVEVSEREFVPPSIPLETLKQYALSDLDNAFVSMRTKLGTVDTHLGFPINATTTSLEDIRGLLDVSQEGDSIDFMDANNEKQTVSYSDLVKMRNAVIRRGQEMYPRKWAYREQILKAQSAQELPNEFEL